MRNIFSRDIPPRAAVVVLAMVLLASVVGGRESRESKESIAEGGVVEAVVKTSPDARSSETMEKGSVPGPVPSALDLDLGILNRGRREAREDLFGNRVTGLYNPAGLSSAVPAAVPIPVAVIPPPPAPPPVPSAPPLPYKYLGMMTPGGTPLVFLLKGEEVLPASTGDTLEALYRVERIAETAIEFTYLPLGTRQRLAIAPGQ